MYKEQLSPSLAIFSDEGHIYRSPEEPNAGDTVRLSIRVPKSCTDFAILSLGENGEELSMKSEKTIEDFLKLDDEGKEAILEFLEEFAVFEEIDCNGKKFLLTHAGIDNHDELDLYEHMEEDFIFAKTDYNKIYFPNAYLITGHTPTVAIGKEYAGKVYAKKRHLALDCGAAFGGRLAAVCLDTLKVSYC